MEWSRFDSGRQLQRRECSLFVWGLVLRNTDAFPHRVIRRRHTCLYLFACGCVCELFSGTVHMDTWVERDIRMRSCGSACDGAAPATVRDADHALAVAATPKHLRIVFALGHAHIDTRMRMSCD